MVKDFVIGQLVWIKLSKYPIWPGKIVDYELGFKLSILEVLLYHVLFFGSNKFSYVPEYLIFPHTEKMVQSCPKIKLAKYQKAIDEIRKESSVLQKGKKKRKREESKVKYETAKRYIPKIPRKVQKQFAFADHKSNVDELKRAFAFENEPQKEETCVPESPFVAVEISLKDFSCPSDKLDIEPTSKKIGFIGLGVMGQNIVKNLIITGHKVAIWNRSSMKCEIFVKAGAVQARTPAALVEKCDIIFSCLSGPEAVRSVFSTTNGILGAMKKFQNSNKSYVELSTLDIMTSEELGSKITQRGWRYLDAPVGGTKEEANSGALIIPVSGDLELFLDCESCFAAMAKNVHYVDSEIGSATKLNILTNVVSSTKFATLRETLGLIEECNLSTRKFMKFLDRIPTSFPLERNCTLLKDFSSYRGLEYQEKILNYAVSAANLHNESLFLTRATHEYFKRAKLLAPDNPDMSCSSSRN